MFFIIPHTTNFFYRVVDGMFGKQAAIIGSDGHFYHLTHDKPSTELWTGCSGNRLLSLEVMPFDCKDRRSARPGFLGSFATSSRHARKEHKTIKVSTFGHDE